MINLIITNYSSLNEMNLITKATKLTKHKVLDYPLLPDGSQEKALPPEAADPVCELLALRAF